MKILKTVKYNFLNHHCYVSQKHKFTYSKKRVTILIIAMVNYGLNLDFFRSSHRRCSVRNRCSQKFRKIGRRLPCQSIFLIKVFSCKFCDIFKNTFFTEHLRATSSVSSIKRTWNCTKCYGYSEAVVQRCSAKRAFLEI